MHNIRFVEIAEAFALHEDQIALFGGDAGIRDRGLFESAMAMPRATFGGEFVHEDIIAMAGAYLFHLCKNHAFVDGNKRIALAVTLYFLDINQLRLDAGFEQVQELVLSLAASQLTKDQATAQLRQWVKPLG